MQKLSFVARACLRRTTSLCPRWVPSSHDGHTIAVANLTRQPFQINHFFNNQYLIQDVLRRDPEFSRVLPMSIATSTVSELGLLRTTDKPFLLAHGQDERVINGEYLEKIAKAGDLKTLFENKVQVFKKSGHTPQVEATADYNAVVGAFAKHVFGK